MLLRSPGRRGANARGTTAHRREARVRDLGAGDERLDGAQPLGAELDREVVHVEPDVAVADLVGQLLGVLAGSFANSSFSISEFSISPKKGSSD